MEMRVRIIAQRIAQSSARIARNCARTEIGRKTTSFLTLYPHCLRKGVSLVTHSSKRSFAQPQEGSSILLMTTTRMRTPKVFASIACSRVCREGGEEVRWWR